MRIATAAEAPAAVYWDSSMVLAALTDDPRQGVAREWRSREAAHLLASLTFAESTAVLEHLRRPLAPRRHHHPG